MINANRRSKIVEILEKIEKEQNSENKIELISRAAKLLYKEIVVDKNNYIEVKNKIENDIKYRVAIYGENNISLKLLYKIVDLKKVNIIGVYNDENQDKKISRMKVLSLNELEKENVDYIINLKNGVNDEKIINFYEYLNGYYSYQISNGIEKYKDNNKQLVNLIIGTSSHEVGIEEQLVEGVVINFSISLQDIYFIKKIAETIINRSENTISKCIIGLFYPSFGYSILKNNDLKIKNRAKMYYRISKDIDGDIEQKKMIESYNEFEKLAKMVFNDNYNKIIYNETKGKMKQLISYLKTKEYDRGILTEKEKEEEEKSILNYLSLANKKEIIEENLILMGELLKKLNDENIKPIILICPMAKIWRELSQKYPETRDIFNNCIKELEKDYEFEIYDYFDREEFVDSDFYDASHLNFKGAEKFTKMFAADSGIKTK